MEKDSPLCLEPAFSIAHLRQGVYISGTSHKRLRIGTHPLANQGGGGAGEVSKPATQGKRGRGVALQDLLNAGMLLPGRNKLTVSYKGVTHTASLLRNGAIQFNGQTFQSATAFSIYCKRLQTPGKQGDDGWKSVHYEGIPLGDIRAKYQLRYPDGQPPTSSAAQRATPDTGYDDDPVDEPDVEATGATAQVATAAVTSDQWVQCDRCQQWRIVPDDWWPSVSADERPSWFCEYAGWDLRQYEPGTGPCPVT